jgi:hypothetical protein
VAKERKEGSLISAPSLSAPVPQQSGSNFLPSLGLLLVTGGLFLKRSVNSRDFVSNENVRHKNIGIAVDGVLETVSLTTQDCMEPTMRNGLLSASSGGHGAVGLERIGEASG